MCALTCISLNNSKRATAIRWSVGVNPCVCRRPDEKSMRNQPARKRQRKVTTMNSYEVTETMNGNENNGATEIGAKTMNAAKSKARKIAEGNYNDSKWKDGVGGAVLKHDSSELKIQLIDSPIINDDAKPAPTDEIAEVEPTVEKQPTKREWTIQCVRRNGTDEEEAVSYTHLTLPTICSV